MAARLIRMLAAALLLGGCAPASDAAQGQNSVTTQDEPTDRAVLAGTQAMLIAREGECVLRRAGHPDLPLAPAAPCRFLRAEGQVQQHAYPDRGVDAVVLVVGTLADTARKKHFGIAEAIECGTVAHGLVVRGANVTAARQPQREGMFCVDQGRDEKDFYAAAHER